MATDLIKLCEKMVAIPSVSQSESDLASFVHAQLSSIPFLEVVRISDNVVARFTANHGRRAIIAGHLDTVPPAGNEVPVLESGRIYGLGSADMKSGLSVMLGLAEVADKFAVDTTFIFYACEEVASRFSGLLQIDKARPDFLAGDVAVLMEPTSTRIEAGCQGSMRVRVDLVGRRAHTARPWIGVNAIHRLGDIIQLINSEIPRQPVIDGLVFREALQIVKVEGGVANNVVPDLASITVNYRFAPDKTVEEAFSYLENLVATGIFPEQGDVIELIEAAPGAPPTLNDETISLLLDASGQPPRAKLGWTDVAFFSQRGIAATNFGPGDPLLAHTKEEFVETAEIDFAFNAMVRALSH